MAIGFNCAPACRAEWLPLKFPFWILRRAALYLRRAVPRGYQPRSRAQTRKDGYGNRRVIVFDLDTGKFKRMWLAFDNVATGPKPGEALFTSDDEADGPGPQQFSTNVHGVYVSND